MNGLRIDLKTIIPIVTSAAAIFSFVHSYEKEQSDQIAANRNEIAIIKAEKAAAVKFIAESEVISREYRVSLNNRLDRMEGNINLILKGAHK